MEWFYEAVGWLSLGLAAAIAVGLLAYCVLR